jgi:hypothetical protein
MAGAAAASLKTWVGDASASTSAYWAGAKAHLDEVWLVYSSHSEVAFRHRMIQLANRLDGLADGPFKPLWRGVPSFRRRDPGDGGGAWAAPVQQTENELAWREKVFERFRTAYPDLAGGASVAHEASPVRVHICFQAVPDFGTATKILEGGFAELSNNGAMYGLGSYFSMDLEYVLTRYARADIDGLRTVLVCAAACGSPYPVIEDPAGAHSLVWGPCVPRHDAHVVLVDSREDPATPLPAEDWDACGAKLCSEVVIFEKAQVLPLGVLRFRAEEISGAGGCQRQPTNVKRNE